MKRIDLQQWFYSLVAVALSVGVLLGAIWLIAKAIDKGATFLAGALTALATVAAAGLARHFERRKEGEAARREHLGKLYEDLASAMAGEDRSERAVRKTILQFRRKMLVYAGPDVIKTFTAWWKTLPDDDAPRAEPRCSALSPWSRRCGRISARATSASPMRTCSGR